MKGYSLNNNEAEAPFQRIHLDFGFVRKYQPSVKTNPFLRDRRGFGAYLIIIDEFT